MADKDNHRIQVFTFEGQFLLKFGEKGTKNGQFNYTLDAGGEFRGQDLGLRHAEPPRPAVHLNGVFLNKYARGGSLETL